MADHYKYLKTDLLIVDVVGLTETIWERIGEKSITNNELEKILASEQGSKAWDIYEKGYTLCVNQCEKDGTKNKCKKYKMKNTAELSAFEAGIRPGFRSLINNFLDRKPYTTNVPQLDEILKDSYSYMLYQESIMAFLNWLGIEMKETYDIVKKISKKIYKNIQNKWKN
jgi:DNA polymerase III alpha subunit